MTHNISCPCCLDNRRSAGGKRLFRNPRTEQTKKGEDRNKKATQYSYMCEECIDNNFGSNAPKDEMFMGTSDNDLTSENHAECVARK